MVDDADELKNVTNCRHMATTMTTTMMMMKATGHECIDERAADDLDRSRSAVSNTQRSYYTLSYFQYQSTNHSKLKINLNSGMCRESEASSAVTADV